MTQITDTDRRATFARWQRLAAFVARKQFRRCGRVGRLYGPDDAAQQALIRLWNDAARGQLSHRVVIRLARSAAIDGYRSAVGKTRGIRNVGQINTQTLNVAAFDRTYDEPGLTRVDARDEVARFMAGCPQLWVTAAWLRYGCGWSVKSVAEACGRCHQWVSVYSRAALER